MITYTLICNGDGFTPHTTFTNGSSDLQECLPVYINFISDKKLSFIRRIMYYLTGFRKKEL